MFGRLILDTSGNDAFCCPRYSILEIPGPQAADPPGSRYDLSVRRSSGDSGPKCAFVDPGFVARRL